MQTLTQQLTLGVNMESPQHSPIPRLFYRDVQCGSREPTQGNNHGLVITHSRLKVHFLKDYHLLLTEMIFSEHQYCFFTFTADQNRLSWNCEHGDDLSSTALVGERKGKIRVLFVLKIRQTDSSSLKH